MNRLDQGDIETSFIAGKKCDPVGECHKGMSTWPVATTEVKWCRLHQERG